MYDMPLTFLFWGFGVGRAIFVLGYWALAFLHWRFVSRSTRGVQSVPGHSLALHIWSNFCASHTFLP